MLRETDDFEDIRALALASGLEDIVVAYGCYISGEMVGCVALKMDGTRHSIDWLAVTVGLRRMGLDRISVTRVEAEARRSGANRIWALARAPRFFEGIGFRAAGPGESGGPAM